MPPFSCVASVSPDSVIDPLRVTVPPVRPVISGGAALADVVGDRPVVGDVAGAAVELEVDAGGVADRGGAVGGERAGAESGEVDAVTGAGGGVDVVELEDCACRVGDVDRRPAGGGDVVGAGGGDDEGAGVAGVLERRGRS